MDSLFLLTTVFIYIYLFTFLNKIPEVPEYAKIQFHIMTSL